MYLWKVDDLVEDLKAGRVTQWEQFKSCLAIAAILCVLVWIVGAGIGVNLGIQDKGIGDVVVVAFMLNLPVSVVIAVLGIGVCYQINRKGDNTDFLLRMICLGVPVVLRMVAFCYAPLIILAMILVPGVGVSMGASVELSLSKGLSYGTTVEEAERATHPDPSEFGVILLLVLIAAHLVAYTYQAIQIHKVSRDA